MAVPLAKARERSRETREGPMRFGIQKEVSLLVRTLHLAFRHSFQRQVAATDAQIDQLVYELYALTDEEIKIVEQAARTG
jgi:hypothetical protein